MSANLEHIAKLAGVSRSTVSRVLNNHPYVKAEVRQRVLEVIEREGFHLETSRPQFRQRTNVIGVIAPEGLSAVFSSSYFPILLGGISNTITQTNYAMSLWASTALEENERMYQRILTNRLMDGALLISAVAGDSLPQRLSERGIALVVIGNSTFPHVTTVDIDNVEAARQATQYLISRGRRRIAHITGRMDIISARERLQGYQQALDDGHIHADPKLVMNGDFSEVSGYTAFQCLHSHNIDGLFAANDPMAAGALRAMKDHGMVCPDDISLVGFDDVPLAAQMLPQLTTIRQPAYQMGVVAIETLIKLINNESIPPQRITLPTELIIRQT